MRSSRRDALRALGVAAATATVTGLAPLARAAASRAHAPTGKRTRKTPKPQRSAAPGDYLADLRGACFAGCTVTDVAAIEHGCVAVTFKDPERASFTVDVLRHDPASPGVARAGSLAVYMKVGHGRQVTHEAHGLAAMALASTLAQREAAGAPVPALLTLEERAEVRMTWNRRDIRAS